MSGAPEVRDPGWRPAIRVAPQLIGRRAPSVSLLVLMRATVVLLSTVAGVAGLAALLLGAGSGVARLDGATAHVLLGCGVVAAAAVMAVVGRVLPEVGPDRLAAFLFVTTQRKVIASAAVGPLGLLLSWLAADGALVVYGVGGSILLMAVASPTVGRLGTWQDEVDTFAVPYPVLEALMRPYH